MALVTLAEYAQLHNLRINNVRTARTRGRFATAVKQHGVWMVDDAEPWYMDRERDWFDPIESASLDSGERAAYDRTLMIRHYARCGEYHETFNSCLESIPQRVRDALPVQDVAALVDAIHDSYEQGYKNALNELA